jgi:hypothetical protein
MRCPFATLSGGVKYALNTDSISEFYTTGSCIGSWILKRIPCYQTMSCGDCITTTFISWIHFSSSPFTQTEVVLMGFMQFGVISGILVQFGVISGICAFSLFSTQVSRLNGISICYTLKHFILIYRIKKVKTGKS